MNKLNVIKAILISPIFMSLKSFHSPVLTNENLVSKCLKEGLFHITDEKKLIDILESGYLKASNKEISYGKEKVYFFAGIPTFEDVCFNISLKDKLVAIKINPTYEDLTSLIYRNRNDKAIAHENNLNLTDKLIEIVYLGLHKENNQFIYKIISKKEYDNYIPNFNDKDLKNNITRQLKALYVGLEQQYIYTIEYFNSLSKHSKSKKK